MNKKMLIGSIIAVVILILVSFTSVVGFHSVKSDVKTSPLFNMRISRAIGQGQEDISTDYLGHGEETNILFSSRMKRAEQVQKAINIISKMNDKAFSKFVARIIYQLGNQEQMTEKETSDVLKVLYYIRKDLNVIKYYETNNIPIDFTLEYFTCFGSPGCIYNTILFILMTIFLAIAGWITSHTCIFTADVCCYP